MHVASVCFSLFVLLGCLAWMWVSVCGLRMILSVPLLADLSPREPREWPTLSILVPACNEADTIEEASAALLREDYPSLQVILIDDRSTDGTRQIIDALAARDSRVTAVHVDRLPEGWLGKVHALQRALPVARGEWLLLSDADVHYAPGTLRKAIAHAVERGFDHLTALPHMLPGSFALDSVISAFGTLFTVGARVWSVGDPDSTAFVGVGAFNLVRRSAFDGTPGLQWLKLEIVDDVGLGLMMKRSGARCGVVNARGCISLHWYRTLGQFARGAERTWATLARFSMLRLIVLCALLAALTAAPFAGLLPLAWPRLAIGPVWAAAPALAWVALATIVIKAAMAVVIGRWTGRRVLPGLASPVGAALLIVALLRGGIVCSRRGGIVWRGVLYPTSALRGQQRVGYA
jgi:hypothetical protein